MGQHAAVALGFGAQVRVGAERGIEDVRDVFRLSQGLGGCVLIREVNRDRGNARHGSARQATHWPALLLQLVTEGMADNAASTGHEGLFEVVEHAVGRNTFGCGHNRSAICPVPHGRMQDAKPCSAPRSWPQTSPVLSWIFTYRAAIRLISHPDLMPGAAPASGGSSVRRLVSEPL